MTSNTEFISKNNDNNTNRIAFGRNFTISSSESLLLTQNNNNNHNNLLFEWEISSSLPSSIIKYRLDGNPSYLSPESLNIRNEHRDNSEIMAKIQELWNLLEKNNENKLSISYQTYCSLMLRICHLLNPDLNYSQAKQLVHNDWINDLTKYSELNLLNNKKYNNNNNKANLINENSLMNYSIFESSIFELIDQWSMGLELTSYLNLLDKIYQRITVKINNNKDIKQINNNSIKKIKPINNENNS